MKASIAAHGVAVRSVAADVDGSDCAYDGGKGQAGVYHRHIRLMPPHTLFISAFMGKCAVMRHKRPAAASVGIDSDAGVITWWQRYQQRGAIALNRKSGPSVTGDAVGRPARAARAIPNLELIQGNALRILASRMTMIDRETLLYLDPPYLIEERTRLFYDHEFATPQLHASLLTLLQEIDRRRGAMIMICGYPSSLYAAMLERKLGWKFISYQAMTRGGKREERVWFNFTPPDVLHDCRFAGANYRERLRIRRKAERWRRMLMAMGPLERQVLAQVAIDVAGGDAAANAARDAGGLANA